MSEELCPCGSGAAYAACCGPYLAGERPAPTAEALMRSRYTAFTRCDMPYLEATHAPETRGVTDRSATEAWARTVTWLGLAITGKAAGGPADSTGVVSFEARYREGGQERIHKERSRFRREGDGWLYVDGDITLASPPKVGRNDPCPCGSGAKFKKCCG